MFIIMKFRNKNWRVTTGLISRVRKNPDARDNFEEIFKTQDVSKITYMTIVWLFLAIVLPFIMLVVWGWTLAKQPSLDPQIGLGIALFGIVILSAGLGLSHWYGSKWSLSNFTRIMFVKALLAAFIFCFIFTLIPTTYTYNGTTAVFLSANYIFAIALTHLKSTRTKHGAKEKFLKTEIVVKKMRGMKCFYRDIDPPSIDEVMNATGIENEKYQFKVKLCMLGFYLLTFITYAIAIFVGNPSETKWVGFANFFLVFTADLT